MTIPQSLHSAAPAQSGARERSPTLAPQLVPPVAAAARHPIAKVRVLHLITNLLVGGAEMMLLKLLQNQDRNRFESEVVSLRELGPIDIGDRHDHNLEFHVHDLNSSAPAGAPSDAARSLVP